MEVSINLFKLEFVENFIITSMYRVLPGAIFNLASQTGLHGPLLQSVLHGSNSSTIFILNIDIGLVKNTPHAPGRLFVGVAPHKHIRKGSNVRSETKIFNLDSNEFGSNPPLKKISHHFHFGGQNWQ
jgi:hypothetical protein